MEWKRAYSHALNGMIAYCGCSFRKCAGVCFVMATILLFTPKCLMFLFSIFVHDVFKSVRALFICFHCCMAVWHAEDWMACLCVWTCALVFVCVRVSVCRFKCPKSTHRSLDHWKLRGLKMWGGHFGVLIQPLMAHRNSTHSNPQNKCVFVRICGWSSMWKWPEREGHPPLVQCLSLQAVWKRIHISTHLQWEGMQRHQP